MLNSFMAFHNTNIVIPTLYLPSERHSRDYVFTFFEMFASQTKYLILRKELSTAYVGAPISEVLRLLLDKRIVQEDGT